METADLTPRTQQGPQRRALSRLAAKAIKIKTTITPLEGGWAGLGTFSGKAYGQTVSW